MKRRIHLGEPPARPAPTATGPTLCPPCMLRRDDSKREGKLGFSVCDRCAARIRLFDAGNRMPTENDENLEIMRRLGNIIGPNTASDLFIARAGVLDDMATLFTNLRRGTVPPEADNPFRERVISAILRGNARPPRIELPNRDDAVDAAAYYRGAYAYTPAELGTRFLGVDPARDEETLANIARGIRDRSLVGAPRAGKTYSAKDIRLEINGQTIKSASEQLMEGYAAMAAPTQASAIRRLPLQSRLTILDRMQPDELRDATTVLKDEISYEAESGLGFIEFPRRRIVRNPRGPCDTHSKWQSTALEMTQSQDRPGGILVTKRFSCLRCNAKREIQYVG